MAQIIDGKKLALRIRSQLAAQVVRLRAQGIEPALAVVLVGDNPASQVYVRSKSQACSSAGIAHRQITLPATTNQKDLIEQVALLNADPAIHGILVQLPLPSHLDSQQIIKMISPEKDVDGFHPLNMGLLSLGLSGIRPCTPMGIMAMLDHVGVTIPGKQAVVVGRSSIVGKPIALLLLAAHATVTVCHSRTADLAAQIRNADILIAAIGRPNFIQGEWIKPGAVVIDVGINRLANGTLVGDVDPSAATSASWLTPVPGGVGPMTIAMLLKNTIELAEKRLSIPS